MNNAINWFEIPALNFDRAVGFYESILNIQIRREIFSGLLNGIFPTENGIGGAVVQGEQYQPSDKGAVIYLNAGDDIDGVLKRIPEVGGTILLPKTDIGAPGFIAMLLDTEGNKIGLHMDKRAT
jgi:predicted enzyme related to lactoylglutathione lyase